MQWDYVYADLQVRVTFDAEAKSAFAHLTDSETMALQQLVYHGLMIFLNIRTLYAADVAAIEKAKPDVNKLGLKTSDWGQTNDDVCNG